MRDLTQHLTTRADDNHAPPVSTFPEGHLMLSASLVGCQALVRFFALLRIKPHNPLLVRAPVNSFEFNLAAVLPRWNTYCVNSGTEGSVPPHLVFIVYSVDYQGNLILFAPTLSRLSVSNVQQAAFATGVPPNIYAFTATLGIPLASPSLKKNSFKCSLWVKPIDFTSDLHSPRLRALYTQ